MKGYDEPEILLSQLSRFCLIGADAGQSSVARAHNAFIKGNYDIQLEVVAIGADEKVPAFGSFVFGKSDNIFRHAVDEALLAYLGSDEHRAMLKKFGFDDAEIDLVTG